MINSRCVLKAGHICPGGILVVFPYLTIGFHLVIANLVALSATLGTRRARVRWRVRRRSSCSRGPGAQPPDFFGLFYFLEHFFTIEFTFF